ncbi:MAG: hypothetical protein WA082_04540 [Candidatus Moraniibacteriota bacterium]
MKIVELRREIKTYYGIEYALVLIGPEGKYAESFSPLPGDVYPDLWWCLEWTENSRVIAQYARPKFLWWDTKEWTKDRLMNKKNQCELQAVLEINWLMGMFAPEIGKYLLRELWGYFFVMMSTFPQQILFRVKKLMGKQA